MGAGLGGEAAASAAAARRRKPEPRRRPSGHSRRTALFAHGEPMIWVTGGSLAVALLMITGLLTLVFVQGVFTFWPSKIVQVTLADGRVLAGEVTRAELWEPPELQPPHGSGAPAVQVRRRLLRTGNFELSGEHFAWISDHDIRGETEPGEFLVVERLAWGRFYGVPVGYVEDGRSVTATAAQALDFFDTRHGAVRDRWRERRALETDAIGDVNHELERQRLQLREVELASGRASPEWAAADAAFEADHTRLQGEYAAIRERIRLLDERNAGSRLLLRTADGQAVALNLADIVRAYPASGVGFFARAGIYASRWIEFLTDSPREANSEGGVWPAIFGTVMMTLVMSLLVVPFGVLAALYLREYARPGAVTSAVRIAVNNLAGVPSIVFGVFGLGFFCYIVGARVDELFFSARLPSPTFGTGGVLWASLTLALLTLPVVIVATEEALSAVPGSMREGSYACGASKWQTIRRIVLPRAMPGIMTGMILALARGAGEVAPLMLVGAAKLAPELPVDGNFPYVHLERSFMHLGFHIYDLGFQSQNSEAAKPMVYTTTLLLIGLVVVLNIAAITVRSRLRARYVTGKF